MRNKLIIACILILAGFLVYVRYKFSTGKEEFSVVIANYEHQLIQTFEDEKTRKLASLADNPQLQNQVIKNFDLTKAIITADTTFSFFYLSDDFSYKKPVAGYLDCLIERCKILSENESQIKLASKAEKKFTTLYSDAFRLWYPNYDSLLVQRSPFEGICGSLFPDDRVVLYREDLWEEFGSFLSTYVRHLRASEIDNRRVDQEYQSKISALKNSLNDETVSYMNNLLATSTYSVVSELTDQHSYSSPNLGTINYSITKKGLQLDNWERFKAQVQEENYKYNSLYTGATPYSSCYGANNYCDGYGCSQIRVVAGYSDVIVTIKNSRGSVVRHGYIANGSSYTFDVPDGEYQVFFYTGSGWNPYKEISTSYCQLSGGFVADERFSKDNSIHLFSQIMTYELILQRNGNFSTEESSKSEIFN